IRGRGGLDRAAPAHRAGTAAFARAVGLAHPGGPRDRARGDRGDRDGARCGGRVADRGPRRAGTRGGAGMSRRAGPIGIAVRSAMTSPALTVFAMVIVALTAFTGAAAPGMLQRVQSDSLRYSLAATGTVTRDFGASQRGTPVPGSGRDDLGLPT